MTKVKICGITNLEDGLLSARFGANALGFNFYQKSPRYIVPDKAHAIVEQLPANILSVGVFVNEDLNKIVEIIRTTKFGAVQLHGEETPKFVKELKSIIGLEIIKAFRVSPDFRAEHVLQYEVDNVLVDTYSPEEYGGTGEIFNWEIAARVREIFPKVYLAGGLSAGNIQNAIATVRPYAVDACSKLEREKGVKDPERLESFFRAFAQAC